MKADRFAQLLPAQQITLLIAMQVRNAMEDFHVKHLSDEQMAELNPIIREAIFDAISLLDDNAEAERRELTLGFLIAMIPDFWEIPSK